MTLLYIITEQRLLLENKAQVDQMINAVPFDKLHELSEVTEADARTFLEQSYKYAHERLRKRDRVIWWVNMARLALVSSISQDGPNKLTLDAPKFFKGWVHKHGNDAWYSLNLYGAGTLLKGSYLINRLKDKFNRMSVDIEHYLSLADVHSIQNTDFADLPVNVHVENFKKAQQEWQANRRRTVAMPEQDRNADHIIKFPDGYVWLNLKRASCSIEGKALGHCGNSPRSGTKDTILSLRKYNPAKEEFTYAVTFILEEDGYLGERKGANNNKPHPDYHPYIVELLKLPIIKGIKAGRWFGSGDFQVGDLNDKLAYSLYKARPDYFNVLEISRLKQQFENVPIIDSIKEGLNQTQMIVDADTLREFRNKIKDPDQRALVELYIGSRMVGRDPSGTDRLYYYGNDKINGKTPIEDGHLIDVLEATYINIPQDVRQSTEARLSELYRQGYQSRRYSMSEIGDKFGWNSKELLGQIRSATKFDKYENLNPKGSYFLNESRSLKYLSDEFFIEYWPFHDWYEFEYAILKKSNGDKDNLVYKLWEVTYGQDMAPNEAIRVLGNDSPALEAIQKRFIKEASIKYFQHEGETYYILSRIDTKEFIEKHMGEIVEETIRYQESGYTSIENVGTESDHFNKIPHDDYKDLMMDYVGNDGLEEKFEDHFGISFEDAQGSLNDIDGEELMEFIIDNEDYSHVRYSIIYAAERTIQYTYYNIVIRAFSELLGSISIPVSYNGNAIGNIMFSFDGSRDTENIYRLDELDIHVCCKRDLFDNLFDNEQMEMLTSRENLIKAFRNTYTRVDSYINKMKEVDDEWGIDIKPWYEYDDSELWDNAIFIEEFNQSLSS